MSQVNRIVISGRLTRDPELRTTQSGASVAAFTVACDRPRSKDREPVTDFINCVAWRNTADFIAKYFVKGQQIIVDGKLYQRKYATKEGENRVTYEINVESAFFAAPARSSADAQYGSGYADYAASAAGKSDSSGFSELDEGDGELPF